LCFVLLGPYPPPHFTISAPPLLLFLHILIIIFYPCCPSLFFFCFFLVTLGCLTHWARYAHVALFLSHPPALPCGAITLTRATHSLGLCIYAHCSDLPSLTYFPVLRLPAPCVLRFSLPCFYAPNPTDFHRHPPVITPHLQLPFVSFPSFWCPYAFPLSLFERDSPLFPLSAFLCLFTFSFPGL